MTHRRAHASSEESQISFGMAPESNKSKPRAQLAPAVAGKCVRAAGAGRAGGMGRGEGGGGSLGGSRVGVDCNALIIFALDPTEQPAVGVFCVF